MKQGKTKIILCGKTIVLDKTLIQTLQEFCDVKVFNNCCDLLNLSLKEGEKLILWELSGISKKQLKEITSVKERYSNIKIIVINGGASTKVAAEILKAGASDIFPKPFDNDLLIDRVVALLSLKTG
jgi:DNA-binding NtrC family response regulator